MIFLLIGEFFCLLMFGGVEEDCFLYLFDCFGVRELFELIFFLFCELVNDDIFGFLLCCVNGLLGLLELFLCCFRWINILLFVLVKFFIKFWGWFINLLDGNVFIGIGFLGFWFFLFDFFFLDLIFSFWGRVMNLFRKELDGCFLCCFLMLLFIFVDIVLLGMGFWVIVLIKVWI